MFRGLSVCDKLILLNEAILENVVKSASAFYSFLIAATESIKVNPFDIGYVCQTKQNVMTSDYKIKALIIDVGKPAVNCFNLNFVLIRLFSYSASTKFHVALNPSNMVLRFLF